MLVWFIFLLLLIWAFHCWFYLEFFYLAWEFLKDFLTEFPIELFYFNTLLLISLLLSIIFWMFFCISLGAAFLLNTLKQSFQDASQFFFIFFLLHALVFCVFYKVTFFLFFFLPKFFRYYREKGFFTFNFFLRNFVFNNYLNFPSIVSVRWLKQIEFGFSKFFVDNFLYFFYLKFFLLYSVRYFFLFIFFIFSFIFNILRNLLISRFYLIYILIYIFYFILHFLFFRVFLSVSKLILSIFFHRYGTLRKILGRVVSYDDFTYIFTSDFIHHKISLFYTLFVPFSLNFLFKPFVWLTWSYYYLKRFMVLFISVCFLWLTRTIFFFSFNIKNFLISLILVDRWVKFYYFVLNILLKFKYKNIFVLVFNLIFFYLVFIFALFSDLKRFSFIQYLNFLAALTDSIIYLIFLLINSIWFFFVFLCTFFVYIFKSCFYIFLNFLFKLRWFLFLILLLCSSYNNLLVEFVPFLNFFYAYSGFGLVFDFILRISPFPILNWDFYAEQVSEILRLATIHVSNLSYFHHLLQKVDFPFTVVGYLNYFFIYNVVSNIPLTLVVFFQTSFWIWFGYYLVYWHYIFSFILFLFFQYFSLYFPLFYYTLIYNFSLMKLIFGVLVTFGSNFFIFLFPVTVWSWFLLWYVHIVFLSFNFFLELKNLFLFVTVDHFFFELLFSGLSLVVYKLFNLHHTFLPNFFVLPEYPLIYYDLPYYDLSMKKTEALLKHRRTQAHWRAWGFYSRPGFDSLAYSSPYARYRNNSFNLSPIKGLRSHTIDFSLRISDRKKIFTLLNLYDRRFRSHASYSLSVLKSNGYVSNFFEVTKLNNYLEGFSDMTLLRKKRRHLGTLIPLNNVSRLQSIPYIFLFFSFFLVFYFFYFFFKGFNKFLSLDSKDLYNPEAAWWYYRNDSLQHYTWYISAVFLADTKSELLTFQKLLNNHTQSFTDMRSFWSFFHDMRSKVNYMYNFNPKAVLIENIYAAILYSKSLSAFKSLFLSVSFLEKAKISSDYFLSISFRNLDNNSWLSRDGFSIRWNWNLVNSEKNLVFEDKFPLDVIWLKKFSSFFDESNYLLGNWDNFLIRPFGPYNSFLYYLNIFSLFYKQYNLDLYISKLRFNFWLTLKDTYSLKVLFQLIYDNSFVSAIDSIDEYSFSDYPFVDYFLETSYKNLTIYSNLNFFSSFYHDFIQLNKWDLYENLLVFYDSRTANISTQINIEVDQEDNIEEEDEEFSDFDSFDYYYLTYLDFDIAGADPFYWAQLNSDVKRLAGKMTIFSFFFIDSSWVDKFIKLGDLEEYIPDYLSEGRPELEIWDYTEDVGYLNLVKSYYYYELSFLDKFKTYFIWLDSKIFDFKLPWWSFHKDYFYFAFREYETIFGKQFLDDNDFSEIFPFFFYWFFTFFFCLIHVVVWTNYLNLLPYLKFLFGYCVWGFVFNYFCYYNFFPFFGDNSIVNIYFDPEISNFIYYVPQFFFYNYISRNIIDGLIADSYLSAFSYYIISCFFTVLHFYASYFRFLVIKVEWFGFFFIFLLFIYNFSNHIRFVFNRFIYFDSYILFKIFYLLRFKFNAKKKFLYDFKNKI